MAYQALNIIGSLTAGLPAVQYERQVDRDRADAYRATLRQRVLLNNRTLEASIADRLVVGDSTDERPNPYLFLRYAGAKREQFDHTDHDQNPGDRLDLVV